MIGLLVMLGGIILCYIIALCTKWHTNARNMKDSCKYKESGEFEYEYEEKDKRKEDK